jgi:signal transduction histidine kinase
MRATRYAAWLAGTYVVLGGVWIFFSSELVVALTSSAQLQHQLEQGKGFAFVIVTGLALFGGARTLFRRLEATNEELLRRQHALVSNERRVFAGLLAASVAHDANNVLTGVLSDIDELTDPSTVPADLDAARARLGPAVQRLIELNRRMVQAGRQRATDSKVPLALDVAVRDAVELVRRHPALREATVELTTPPVTLQSQPVLFSQIITNLVVNAGEATAGKGRVGVRLVPAAAEVVLEVHDSGAGVPVERRAGLFEALATTKPEGNGMGLFSVRACARALGGDVAVTESDLGGACFRVTLPLGQPR